MHTTVKHAGKVDNPTAVGWLYPLVIPEHLIYSDISKNAKNSINVEYIKQAIK